MSIASNVIEENSRLGTVRTNLRNKLTLYGVCWYNSDTIATLARRVYFIQYPDIPGSGSYPSPEETASVGQTLEFIASGFDANGGVLDLFINDNHYVFYNDSDTAVTGTYVVTEDDLETGEITFAMYVNGQKFCEETLAVKLFSFVDESGDDNAYRIIKYPTDIGHSLETYEYDTGYADSGMMVSKEVVSASVVMLIPKVFSAPLDAAESGNHFKAGMVQKKDSNQGCGDVIALISSDSLDHYRDTKILELGAYPAKKGVKYSNSDHVVRDISTTTGQLTLDSKWYTLDMYYDSGYLEATIKDGNTNVFSYSGDISNSIAFDEFYPVIMIYEAGGKMIFNNVIIEPWTREVENNG